MLLIGWSLPVVWRWPEMPALMAGNWFERWIWYCARAASMLRIATRRSRLLARASEISCCRRGSVKKCCHAMAAGA